MEKCYLYVLGESTCFSSLTTSLSQKVDHNIVDWALAKESEDLGSRIGSITLNRRTKGKISLRLFPQLQNRDDNTSPDYLRVIESLTVIPQSKALSSWGNTIPMWGGIQEV